MGSTTIRSFECCWKSAQHQNEMILQRRKMSWAVTKDVGERGPAINLNVFHWLHNIQTKKFFNSVKTTEPCLGEHGPAARSNVFEKLHTIQMKKVFDTMKRAGPCLREQDHPFIWTLLKACITSKQEEFSTPQSGFGRDRGCWGARSRNELEWFTWLHNIQTKWFFNTVKEFGPCLGKHGPTISSNVFEILHTIQTKMFFNTAKCAGPCLWEHDQPFIWTLLKLCITSKRNDSSTPRNEVGRERGCWGARPSL